MTRIVKLKQWRRDGLSFEEITALLKRLESEKKRAQVELVNAARRLLRFYALAESELRLKGATLAILIAYIDFSKGINKVKAYARECKEIKGGLARYVSSIYMHARKEQVENLKYAEIARSTATRREALKKIQAEILKDLRRLWKNTSPTSRAVLRKTNLTRLSPPTHSQQGGGRIARIRVGKGWKAKATRVRTGVS